MELPPQEQCMVSGMLGRVLRLSRVFGLASLKFKDIEQGWQISISKAVSCYGKFVLLLLGVLLICTYAHRSMIVGFDTSSETMGQFASITVVLAVLIHELCFNSYRMQHMITCLAQVQKINAELSNHGARTSFKRSECFIAVWSLLHLLCILTLDIYLHFGHIDFNLDSGLAGAMLLSYYIVFGVTKLLNLQISLILAAVLYSFDSLNYCLKNLLQQVSNEDSDKKIAASSRKTESNAFTVVSYKSLNSIIDSMAIYKAPVITESSRAPHETLRRFGFLYCFLYDIVKDLDKSHGMAIVLLIAAHFLEIIVSIYNLFMAILGPIDSGDAIFRVLWAVYYTCDILYLIEPCHQTNQKTKETKYLIRQLMLFTPADMYAFTLELELFCQHVMLHEVFYAPMKMFELNRAVITAILGSATTYLIVMIQL